MVHGVAGPARVIFGRSVLALMLLAVTGCGAHSAPNPFLADQGRVRVEIDNVNFNDATVTVLSSRSGLRRLGVVAGKTKGSFDFDWKRDGQLRLRVTLLAGAGFTTQSIYAEPGDILSLTITPNLRRTIFKR